ncbi:MAG: DUF2380 domain-containing protein [Chitinispirillaceae bacterium]|nr:DUF2380 domain-containing protein [Chitinispirillaceae bacterium]
MKHVVILLLLVSGLLADARAQTAAEPKTNYAVVNLKSSGGVTEGESELITDRLRSELFNTGKVNVMERNQMQEILTEQGFQQSGACTDEACLVEMGQMLGVKILVVGSLGKLGSMFMVNIRAIDVQTAQIVKVVSVDIKGDIEEVVEHLKDIARKLTGTDTGVSPAPEVAARPVETETQEEPEPAAAPETTAVSEQKEAPEEEEEEVGAAATLDEKTEKNRNRGGVGISFTLLPGNVRHTKKEWDETYEDEIYLQLDSTWFYNRSYFFEYVSEEMGYSQTATPMMDFLVRFQIRAGKFLTVEVGPHFLFGTETWEYVDLYLTDRLDLIYMSIGAHVGVNYVKRIYPLKINAGIFANFTVPIIYYEFAEESYNSTYMYYEMDSDSDVKLGFRVTPGVRTGAEILAGKHVGFSVDFIFQWLSMDLDFDFDEMDIEDSATDTDITQQITFPAFGIGLGVNFYF